jgi:Flp pilus assembly protein TadD
VRYSPIKPESEAAARGGTRVCVRSFSEAGFMAFSRARSLRWMGTTALLLSLTGAAFAGADLHVKIPKKTKPTPVQKLNQEGVKALEKHSYKRAKKLFYEAYLLDPDDPFTLNNLGYMAELDGEIDRAQRYYSLAADQNSEAIVATATTDAAKGKAVGLVAGSAADDQMRVNRLNVYAIGLLEKDRAPEADVALQKALTLDPKNPFTMNNLGYAKEKEGELQQALKYYSQAATSGSHEPVIVSIHPSWRGKPIDEIADANAKKVQRLMNKEEDTGAQVARLNLRGVSALNRNERSTARDLFQQAYKLEPNNAFTLNNMGYLAEIDGDRETANYFYAKAQDANRSNSRVIVATRKDAEGKRVAEVASNSDIIVTNAQEAAIAARRRSAPTTVTLHERNGQPVPETPTVDISAPATKGLANQPVVTTTTEEVAAPAPPPKPAAPVEVIRPILETPDPNAPATTQPSPQQPQ